jgi:glycosyltransferase involved in cell wall biosynthesis
MPLSVVINTKNVAKTLERTLKSVEFADEIVVVDMHSTDDTVEIAKKYTDKVFEFEDRGYVEPARNFAIQQATQDWILIVDADEEVSAKLRQAVKAIISAKEGTSLPDCFYLPRKNIIFGSWIRKTGWWPDYVMRFFRKGAVEWSDELHAVPITRGVVKELPANEDLALIHHNYQSVDQFVSRLNRYTSIQAKELIHDHKQGELDPAHVVRQFSDEFFRRFFAQQGIDEGMHGTGLSFLQTFSEVVRTLKVWELQGFPEMAVNPEETMTSLKQFRRELNYWIADWHVQHAKGISALVWRIRRKLLW